jgi:hypothetical protein
LQPEELFETVEEMDILDVDEEVKTLMRKVRSNARSAVDSDTRVSDAIDIIRLALNQ